MESRILLARKNFLVKLGKKNVFFLAHYSKISLFICYFSSITFSDSAVAHSKSDSYQSAPMDLNDNLEPQLNALGLM
jgi:hypothetical protein